MQDKVASKPSRSLSVATSASIESDDVLHRRMPYFRCCSAVAPEVEGWGNALQLVNGWTAPAFFLGDGFFPSFTPLIELPGIDASEVGETFRGDFYFCGEVFSCGDFPICGDFFCGDFFLSGDFTAIGACWGVETAWVVSLEITMCPAPTISLGDRSFESCFKERW